MMRRFIIFFYVLAISSALFAQSPMSELYKQWIVQDINNGKYSNVVSLIDKVEDWAYIPNEQTPYIVPEKFNSLMHYIESLQSRPRNTDSLIVYYTEELYRMAHYYMGQMQYDIALDLCSGVSQIRENVLGKDHFLTAIVFCDLGNIYLNLGNITEAEHYLYLANNSLLNSIGSNHPFYGACINNLALLSEAKGDYLTAEQYYIQFAGLMAQIFGKNSTDYAIAISNLGNTYENIGDWSKAAEYYLEALNIIEATEGRNSLEYAGQLVNLGMCCKKLSLYNDAEKFIKNAVSIYKSLVGEQNLLYARALNNYGVLLCAMGRQSEAEQYCLKALEIREASGDLFESITSLRTVAVIMEENKNNKRKAEEYWLRALDLYKKAYVTGMGDLDYASLLANVFSFYLDQKNYPAAKKYYKESYQLYKDISIKILENGSEHQRQLFWSSIAGMFYSMYPRYYHTFQQQESITEEAYDNELFSKGILLTSIENVRRAILESGNPILIQKWDELIAKREQISAFEENNPRSPQLKQLREEAESIEKQIMLSSSEFRRGQEQWKLSWIDVRDKLGANQVAIEYFNVPTGNGTSQYYALLIRRNSQTPKLISICNEKDILSIINIDSENGINRTYGASGQQLSDLIWSKVISSIKSGETIYFAPSGILHQIAIEALPFDTEHTMGDMYNLVRLSSTREIVFHNGASTLVSATLFGGIQYNMSEEELIVASIPYQNRQLISRGLKSNNNRGTIDYLKGSKTEVENIYRLLKGNKLKVNMYTSTTANEESFKSISGKHQNILHIATHGFYWSDSTAQKKDYFLQRSASLDGVTNPIYLDPLDRCGLLFAGAQTAWSGKSADLPEGVQDGILTAKEISLLDLRDADLVVLSACETGKGEITGEGVFGLQRAFKQAGAQTIIMSLWPVNDAATQLLMTEFYRNWITNHESKREAFRNAQNTVRSKYEEPVYWAGFIMLD